MNYLSSGPGFQNHKPYLKHTSTSSWILAMLRAPCFNCPQQRPNCHHSSVSCALGVDKQVNLEHMGVSKNSGTPKWMIWGYHYFRKHPYKTRPCAHSQKKRGFFVYKYFVKSTNLKNIIWLVVEPTPLKNMLVKMGSSSPNRGEFFKNIWNHLDNANNLVPRDSIGDPTWSPNGFLLGHDSPLRSGHLRSLKTNYPKKKVTFAELPGLNFYIPKDPGSPKLKIVMEPKYLAFRRWLYTPIIIWEYDDWCL